MNIKNIISLSIFALLLLPLCGAVSIAPSNYIMDYGQGVTLTFSWDSTTAPYLVNLYSSTGSSCDSNSTLVISQSNIVTNSTTFSELPSTSLNYCAIVIDSSAQHTTRLSTISHIVVDNPLTMRQVYGSADTIILTRGLTLSSGGASGGTPPYTYQWFECMPGSCLSYSAIKGATSTSYRFITANSTSTGIYRFELVVTDAASTSQSAISPPINITVSAAKNQTIAILLSANSTYAGNKVSIIANISNTIFNSQSYYWGTVGACPDFINPGNTTSFSYNSTASGTTLNCQFKLLATDQYGNTGSGTSEVLSVYPAPAQSVNVILSSNMIKPGVPVKVSANVTGLTFNAPHYIWNATGCPGFVPPGNVSAFNYSAMPSNTLHCKFSVSVIDPYGNAGSGYSNTLAVSQSNGAPSASSNQLLVMIIIVVAIIVSVLAVNHFTKEGNRKLSRK